MKKASGRKKNSTTHAVKPGPEITPEQYVEILNGLELVGISLNSIEAAVTNRRRIHESEIPLQPEFGLACNYNQVQRDGKRLVVVLQTVGLNIGPKDAKPDDEPYMHLIANFQLEYHATVPVTDEFFEHFKKGPLVLQITPFARELVHSMCTRMNIPPLTLPIVRMEPVPTGAE